MEKSYLYKVKAFDSVRGKTFKVLIVAKWINEAISIAAELAGPSGWVIWVKDTNKDVIVKGETENDQSE